MNLGYWFYDPIGGSNEWIDDAPVPTPAPAAPPLVQTSWNEDSRMGSIVSINGYPPSAYVFRREANDDYSVLNPATGRYEAGYSYINPQGFGSLFLPESIARQLLSPDAFISTSPGYARAHYYPNIGDTQFDTGLLVIAAVAGFGAAVAIGASAASAAGTVATESAGSIAATGSPALTTSVVDLSEGTFFSLSPAAADTAIAGQAVWGAVDTVAVVGTGGKAIVDTGTAVGDATQVQAMTGQFTEATGAYTASAGSGLLDLGKQALSIGNQIKSGAGLLATVMGAGGAGALTGTPGTHLTTPTIYATNPAIQQGQSGVVSPAALVKQYWPLLAVAALALALKG